LIRLISLFGLFGLLRLANGCQNGELQNRNGKDKTFNTTQFHLYYLLKMSEILFPDIKDKHSPENNSSRVGQIGEELAARFLQREGYHLVAGNFKTPVGRNRRGAQVTGEIDLIALDADVLCFVEVKTRSSDDFASPLAAVDLRKQRQIIRAARMYRKIFRLQSIKIRYDVISIVLPKSSRPTIELFKSYFNEAKFRKSFWADRL